MVMFMRILLMVTQHKFVTRLYVFFCRFSVTHTVYFFVAHDARNATPWSSRLYAWTIHAADALSSRHASSEWYAFLAFSNNPCDRIRKHLQLCIHLRWVRCLVSFYLSIFKRGYQDELILDLDLAPQGYMPPPPGAYPPPPNGAGPRPSMPPTPIQANAHPYYHQSPQRMINFDQYSDKMFTMMLLVQHAYPMMMPPPPSIPPHGYEGGPPPVQMGGHS